MTKGPTDKQLYKMKNDLLRGRYKKVSPEAFYRDMFPEGSLERTGCYEDNKPNAIFTTAYKKKNVKDGDKKTHYARNTIIFDDLQGIKEVLSDASEDEVEFVISSPLAYYGRRKCAENAFHLWGMAFDLDGVEIDQLRDLLHQIDNDLLPEPTYLVNSGHGFHLYYLFEEPIPLYRYLHKPLKALKYRLTDKIWNRYTSVIPKEKRQHQGIFQGFRVVGSQSKLGKNYPVVAFATGRKRTLRYLNDFVEDQYKVNYDEFNHLTLDEAKEKYPEWYERRIVQGEKPSRWVNKKDLYYWWLRQMEFGAFDGNRYHCISTLFTYAVKCDIPVDEVLNDALELVPRLNRLTEKEKNDFTEQDVYDACTFFNDSYVRYSINAISAKTKIPIKRNKRNFRKQEVHLAGARAIQEVNDKFNGSNWRDGNGRPKGSGTAEQKVAKYRSEHPDANVSEVARALNLSRPTVYKWWDSCLLNSSSEASEKPKFYRYTPTGGEEEPDSEQMFVQVPKKYKKNDFEKMLLNRMNRYKNKAGD